MRSLVAAAIVAGVMAQPAHAATATRLLYTSDWRGPGAVYSVDPNTRTTREVVLARVDTCASPACGIDAVLPSPNGRRILFVDHFAGSSWLYVARSDGANRRLIASAKGINSLAWAHDSSTVAYAVLVASPGQLFPSSSRLYTFELGTGRRRLLEVGEVAAAYSASWSPAGIRGLAYKRRDGVEASQRTELVVVRRGAARVVATGDGSLVYAWAPNGRALAYAGGDIRLVQADGSGERVLADRPSGALGWSRDGRFLASSGADSFSVIEISSRGVHELDRGAGGTFAWAPRRSLLAFESRRGLEVFDMVARARTLLTGEQLQSFAWSSNGGGISFLTRHQSLLWTTGELRFVSLAGSVRTLVRAAGTGGGVIRSPVWTNMPRGFRLRPTHSRVLAEVTADEVRARWDVTKLAADGGRVAFVACNHTFVWMPSARSVVQAEPSESLGIRCSVPQTYVTSESLFDLAIAGDRLAFGETYGCTGGGWSLSALELSNPEGAQELGRGYGSRCGVGFDVSIGEAVGSGPLLVYSTWRGHFVHTPKAERIVASQQILRVGGGLVATREGSLTPLDVDQGRIAVSRGDTFAVLDDGGRELWSVPVGPAAAVFAGDELALVRDGEIRRYRAATGEALGSWALPALPTGRPCKTAFTFWCNVGRLSVQDGARGLLAYELDGRVHVVRLADGVDRDVAAAAMARFFDGGLVVADGPRLRAMPFSALP